MNLVIIALCCISGSMDPWQITTEDRAKYDAQFMQLGPVNGFVTGNATSTFLTGYWYLSVVNRQ